MRKPKSIIVLLFLIFLISFSRSYCKNSDRKIWVNTLTKIAYPVLYNLSNNTLKKNMPFESLDCSGRQRFSRLEAFGRLVSGISPWLELGPDNSSEGKLRAKFINLTVKSLKNAVNPNGPDFLVFDEPSQPLVDAAFLAEGLLRAPIQLWNNLDSETQKNLIDALKKTRIIKPCNNNWLLFSSMIEAALLQFTGECNMSRLTHGVIMFQHHWYKGDSFYGDGQDFHMDYYNSFVIHPMLIDILMVMKSHNINDNDFYGIEVNRLSRYADVLERLISPEGTYPIIGRSACYRFGAFHALAEASLLQILPKHINPAQVRCALTAVIKRQLHSPLNFDKNGWLKIGVAGSQLQLSETYINTGSLYLCTDVFLPLGLSASNKFWSSPFAPWSELKVWNGLLINRDSALE